MYRVVGVVLCAIIVIGALVSMRKGLDTPQDSEMSEISTSTTTTATSSAGLISAEGTGDYTVSVIPLENQSSAKIAPPDHMVSLTFATSVSAEQRATLNKRLAIKQGDITKDTNDFYSWIELGNLHLQAGDTNRARIIWEFVSKRWPDNATSFNNLGDLYMNFTHDYPAAEANYLKQIANKPDDVNAYRMLFALYSGLYKQNTTAAEDILKKAIAANPNAVELQTLLDDRASSYPQSEQN